MSRIGRNPVNIKDITFTQDAQSIKVKGKLGELEMVVHPNMTVEVEGDVLSVKRPNDQKENRALHGLTRALIQNMVTGVTDGYSKSLKIVGVGYKAELKGAKAEY